MNDEVEVCIELDRTTHQVGLLRRQPRRGYEAVAFEYGDEWLAKPFAFSLEPALTLTQGVFSPEAGRAIFGSIGDSAPDTWGRRLLRQAERRKARQEGRPPRTLQELDFLLGVADIARAGALRFRFPNREAFLAETSDGVPMVVHLQRLLEATERALRDEETDEDLRLILAPGSSLGGARPKASVLDSDASLAIAKFPKETDEYSLERWEAIALSLAERAGIGAARARLEVVARHPVIVVARFDRHLGRRVPFLSAMSMLGLQDGKRASYLELVDALSEHGAQTRLDAFELYKRVAFNVLVSNVDDHLRNHGFLWSGSGGWVLSPAYDLNPTPTDVRERRLTTLIDLEDGTCDIELVLSVSSFFGLSLRDAKNAIGSVAMATRTWREVAAKHGAAASEIERMSSAFEHDDLRRALAFVS
jgi:serine/threonine-protein kinase HipA